MDHETKPGGTPKKSILVVDDEESQRKLIRAVLEEKFEVVEASDGLAAAKLAAHQPFVAFLVDLGMPGTRGESFIQWLLLNRPELRHRVLVVTGEAMSNSVRTFLEQTRVSLLTKPYDIKKLTAWVDQAAAS